MTKFKSFLIVFALLLFANSFVLAQGSGHGAHFRIAWLANDPSNAYDNAILAGIQTAAEKSHSTVQPFYAGFDTDVQLTQCNQAVDSGNYDALIIIPNSPIGIIPCVEQARLAGIKVAAVDLVMGTDQTTVMPQIPGQVAASFIPAAKFASAVNALLPDLCAGLSPCNILYVAGFESFPIDQYGLIAIQQAANSNPNVKLIDRIEAYYDTSTAREKINAALDSYPEINVVIVAGDQMALGAEQAAQDHNKVLRITGAGAGQTAINAVRQGRWFATVNALPKSEGEIVTELLVKALRSKPRPLLGIDPVEASGLPVWWTQATLAEHPEFVGQW